MKELRTIQTISKIGKVLSTISMVFGIIGIVGCAIGIVSMVALGSSYAQIYEIIESQADITVTQMYASMVVGIIMCVGSTIVAGYSRSYFKNELIAGTPFTYEGAEELKQLGIKSIVITLVCAALCVIMFIAFQPTMGNISDMDFEISDGRDVILGIVYLIFSVVFKYGASFADNQKTEDAEATVVYREKTPEEME